MKDKLKDIIAQNSFKYSETASFKLACGESSKFYFDCKRTTLRSDGQYYIGNLIFEYLYDTSIIGIGGLTIGADAIATAVAYTSHIKMFRKPNPIHAMIVRKAVKDHGIINRIAGMLTPPENISLAVVDDVITTGASTIEAIKVFKEAGYKVEKAIVLIDREEMNGRANVEEYVPEVISLFKASDFI
jgi:orotate phosphoribosyltransferase